MQDFLYYGWLVIQTVLAAYLLQPLVLLLIFGLKRAWKAVFGEVKIYPPGQKNPALSASW
ncbi:hypothetical protein WJU16_00175 [Chitinophaga pollutisoli]|uniref:Uncharacterized protein n=1 Tax=Chitinophaga pollutisoli TaxID=3133966 RepID=A0ABZ2YPM8_9BACT